MNKECDSKFYAFKTCLSYACRFKNNTATGLWKFFKSQRESLECLKGVLENSVLSFN